MRMIREIRSFLLERAFIHNFLLPGRPEIYGRMPDDHKMDQWWFWMQGLQIYLRDPVYSSSWSVSGLIPLTEGIIWKLEDRWITRQASPTPLFFKLDHHINGVIFIIDGSQTNCMHSSVLPVMEFGFSKNFSIRWSSNQQLIQPDWHASRFTSTMYRLECRNFKRSTSFIMPDDGFVRNQVYSFKHVFSPDRKLEEPLPWSLSLTCWTTLKKFAPKSKRSIYSETNTWN